MDCYKIKALYNYYIIEVLPKKCNVNIFKSLTNHDSSYNTNIEKRFEKKYLGAQYTEVIFKLVTFVLLKERLQYN